MKIVWQTWLSSDRRSLSRKWICRLLWKISPSIGISNNFWLTLNGWFTIASFCIRVGLIWVARKTKISHLCFKHSRIFIVSFHRITSKSANSTSPPGLFDQRNWHCENVYGLLPECAHPWNGLVCTCVPKTPSDCLDRTMRPQLLARQGYVNKRWRGDCSILW